MPEEVPQSLICCVWRGASRSSDIDHSITLSFNASNEFHSQTPSPPRSDNEPDSKVPIEKLPTTIFDAYTPPKVSLAAQCPYMPAAPTVPSTLGTPTIPPVSTLPNTYTFPCRSSPPFTCAGLTVSLCGR